MDVLLKPTVAPHMVLGLPSTSSHDEAIRAFALRSRKVKATADSPYSMEDLTAALSEIEHGSRDGAVSLRYAVPCDSQVYVPGASFLHGGATIDASASLDVLVGVMPSPDQLQSAGLTLLAAATNSLLDWRWADAGVLARECLRVATGEDVRDEALNVLAASLAMQGEPEKALHALQKAVEGKWNLPLQVNLAVIATTEDPSVASSQMSFIIDGATSAEEKLQATRLAIRLWRESQGDELDDDDRDPPAPQLLAAIYGVLMAKDLTEEDFFDIGRFLARIDSDDTKLNTAIASSAFSDSLSAKVIRARRADFSEYVNALVQASARDRHRERPWIQDEVDTLVFAVNSRLADGDKDDSASLSIAFGLLENGLDCSNFPRIALRFLLEMRLPQVLDAKAAPADKFAQWHGEARRTIGVDWASQSTVRLETEQLDILKGLEQSAGNVLGALTHRYYLDIGIKVEQAANNVAARMRGFLNRLTADKDEARRACNEIANICREAISAYASVIPFVSDAGIRNEMIDVKTAFENIRDRIQNVV
jgi:hypothetical protein